MSRMIFIVNIIFFYFISDMWCGVVNNCPVMEGDDVIIGCYAQYDWLSYWLQYNPIVSINASIQFLEDPSTTYTSQKPTPPAPGRGAPNSDNLTTTHTIRNVQAGNAINATCKIRFTFDRATAYSGRNVYAKNSLEYTCAVNQPVQCENICFFLHDAIASTICYENSVHLLRRSACHTYTTCQNG